MKETAGDMQIPTNVASFLKRDDRSVLKEAENLFSVRVKLVKDKYDCDVTNLVIIERPAGSLAAQRFILDKLATTQRITECLYGNDVISLTGSWSESKLLEFEKQNQVSVVAVESQDCSFFLLKGWNRGRLTVAKQTLEKMAREYARTRDTANSQSDESDYSDSDEDISSDNSDDSDDTSDSSSSVEGKGSSKSESEESESDNDDSTTNRGRRDDIGNDVKKCRKRPETGGDSTEHSNFDIGDVMERLDQMSASLINLTKMVQELKGESGCETVTKEPPVTVMSNIETGLSSSVAPLTAAEAAADSDSQVTTMVKPTDSTLIIDDRLIGKVPAMSQGYELTSYNGDIARLNTVSTVAAQPAPIIVHQKFATDNLAVAVSEQDRSMDSSASDGEFEVLTSPRLGTPENSQVVQEDDEEVANDEEEVSGEDEIVVEDLPSEKDSSGETETPAQSLPIVTSSTYSRTPPPGLPARPLAPPSSKTSPADIKPTNMAGKNAFATCGAPRDKALFEDYPDMMNILVLGETGVGKSTFINGLVNYLKYESMDAALNGGVDILIDSAFTLTDDDFKTYDVRSKATVSVEDNRQKAGLNESTVQGQSATQDPKSYIFSWGPKDREKSIRIIDTPGVGDTRGVDQDKKNFQKILSFISDFSEIHAICILIKPNTARLTLAFRFCIDELLVHLHKSASHNILFCFTNTRGTLYKPGDTLPTLREHLLKLKNNRNIDIALEKSTLFSFDHDSFRFMCAINEKFPFTETEKDNFAASWRKSVEETRRLFDRITELPVHSVQDTLSLNNTRNLILTLIRPLGEIAKLQMINRRLIQEKTEEVEHNAMAGKDLCGQLYVEQVVNRTTELDQPQTICTSASCVDHQRMENSEVVTTIYKTVCHENCKLTGVQVETIPNHLLKDCFAMTNEVCKVCGCRWESHMHIKYKIEQSLEKIIDPVVQESIRRRDSAGETINIFLETEQQKMTELMDEQEYITKCCAEFATFLTNNSIMPYNDSYGQYIEHLIREEEEKVAIGGGSRLLEELRMMKLHYEEQVKMLKRSISNKATSVKSVQEIDALVVSLSQLKHCGTISKNIEDIRLHHFNENAVDNGHKIRVKGGLLAGANNGF